MGANMAKTDKKTKEDFSAALGSLREELRRDVLGISESIAQLKAADGRGNDSAAIANSLQALRQDIRHQVNSLAEQIEQAQLEQAQSMLVTPEADTTVFTNAVSSLQEDLQQQVLGLAESIEQLKASTTSPDRQADSEAIADSIQALRTELRGDTTRIAEQIERAQLEQADRAASSPSQTIDGDAIADSIEALRTEVRGDTTRIAEQIEQVEVARAQRDANDFSQANEPRRKGSPVLTTAAMLASLAAGAGGMAFYQNRSQDDSQSQQVAALSAKIDSLDVQNLLQQSAAAEAEREQLASNRLNDTIVALHTSLNDTVGGLSQSLNETEANLQGAVTSLEDAVGGLKTSVTEQDKKFLDGMTSINDSLFALKKPVVGPGGIVLDPVRSPGRQEQANQADAGSQKESDNAGEQGDVAGTDSEKESDNAGEQGDVAGTDSQKESEDTAGRDEVASTPGSDAEGTVDTLRPVPEAKLIIDNPSRFNIKLKINGEEVNIAARGTTRVPVTQGVVKTEIGSYAQEWDDWEVVDDVPVLKIKVESGADYFQLR